MYMENRSDKIKEKLCPTACAGEHYTDRDGVEYEIVYPEGPREVRYQIWSYRVMSVGAIHWYLTFHVDGCRSKVVKVKKGLKYFRYKVGEILWSSGAPEIPEGAQDIRINVTRPVTSEEIGNPRWKDFFYEEGDYTEGFNSYEEAQARARSEFRRIFGKGWKLVADQYNRGYKHL